jgi:hypothetical protein
MKEHQPGSSDAKSLINSLKQTSLNQFRERLGNRRLHRSPTISIGIQRLDDFPSGNIRLEIHAKIRSKSVGRIRLLPAPLNAHVSLLFPLSHTLFVSLT